MASTNPLPFLSASEGKIADIGATVEGASVMPTIRKVKGAGIGASVQDASDLLVPPHAHTRSVVETTAKNDNCIEITIKLTVETQGSLKRKLDDDPCLVTSGLEVERENLVDMEKKTSKSTKKRKMGNGEGSAGSEKTVEKAEPEATKDVHYKAGSEPNDKPKINENLSNISSPASSSKVLCTPPKSTTMGGLIQRVNSSLGSSSSSTGTSLSAYSPLSKMSHVYISRLPPLHPTARAPPPPQFQNDKVTKDVKKED